MSYEYSYSSPGPMAPIWWVQQIVAHAVTVVPPAKIQLGIPAYGRDYVDRRDRHLPEWRRARTRADVRTGRVEALVAEKGVVPVRDEASGELTFSYVDTFTGPPPARRPGRRR